MVESRPWCSLCLCNALMTRTLSRTYQANCTHPTQRGGRASGSRTLLGRYVFIHTISILLATRVLRVITLYHAVQTHRRTVPSFNRLNPHDSIRLRIRHHLDQRTAVPSLASRFVYKWSRTSLSLDSRPTGLTRQTPFQFMYHGKPQPNSRDVESGSLKDGLAVSLIWSTFRLKEKGVAVKR